MNSFLPPIPPPIPLPTDDFVPVSYHGGALPVSKLSLAWRTMREALLMFGLNAFLGIFLSLIGAKFFLASAANTAELQKLTIKPLAMFVIVVLGAPLLEELIFRGTASFIVRGLWKTRRWSEAARDNWYWLVGAISAFLFAVAHGVGDKGLHLPLPQLLMGFVLWHVAMQRGLRFSILMHATYNLLPAILMLAYAGKVK